MANTSCVLGRRHALGIGAGFLFVGALALLTAPATPAFEHPAEVTSVNYTYLPPDLTLRHGQRLAYRNIDIALHNVTSLATAKGGPLFTSDTIAAGEVTEVTGVHDLEPGVYDYTCTLHTFMTGSITIAD
jgi:plastocyanin